MTSDEGLARTAGTVPEPVLQPIHRGGPAYSLHSAEYDGPLIEAVGLGKHDRGEWVYWGVDLALPVGGVLAIVGSEGSGRSSLLLTLAGRMRHSVGELRVAGIELPRRARRVRRRVSVARIGGAIDLEARLTVRETFLERRSLDGVPAKLANAAFDDACELLDLHADPYALVEELPMVDRTRLALAAALIAGPMLVVLDEVDAGLHIHQQRHLWQRIREVAATGVAVAASTADPTPAHGLVDVALPLQRPVTESPTRSRSWRGAARAARGER